MIVKECYNYVLISRGPPRLSWSSTSLQMSLSPIYDLVAELEDVTRPMEQYLSRRESDEIENYLFLQSSDDVAEYQTIVSRESRQVIELGAKVHGARRTV